MRLISILTEISRKMNTHVNLNDVLPVIVESAQKYLGVARVSLFMRKGDRLHIKAWAGFYPDEGLKIKVGTGITGQVALKGGPKVVNYGSVNTEGYTATSFLSLPVRLGEEVIGVLNLTDKEDDFFSQEDIKIAEYIAFQCALAVERAALYGKQLEDERLRALGLLRTSLAHDIHNLLGIVRVYLELMRDSNEIEDIQEYLDAAQVEVARVQGITEDVLMYSRDKQVLNFTFFSLDTLCLSICNQLRLSLKYTDILLSCDGEKIIIQGDEDRLFRAIFNLVNNAIQAVNEKGEVRVRTKANSKNARILICDNGSGIEKKYIPTIFDVFNSNKERGYGLGLFIAREVLTVHGGDISVRSCLGRYTVFRIKIPMK